MKRGENGFSLIELVVAIAILGMTLALAVNVFVRTSQLFSEGQSRSALEHRADSLLEAIGRDLDAMPAASLANRSLRIASADEKSEEFWGQQLAGDQIAFPTRVRTGVAGDSGAVTLRMATIGIDRARGFLLRSFQPWEAEEADVEASADVAASAMAEGVVQFKVEALGEEGEWRRQWNGSAHPRALRVSVVLRDRAHPDQQVSRMRVYPIEAR